MQNAPNAPSNIVVDAENGRPRPEDSVLPFYAGCLGLGLVVLGMGAFGALMYYSANAGTGSLGFAAISGIIILSISLYGLMLLTRAIGMADPTQALALPNGSIRALLALLLAVVFIAVASWTLGGLFDRIGPPVFNEQMKPAEEQQKLAQFPLDRYIVSRTKKGDMEEVKVYLDRQAPDKDLVDIAKQIVTISATILVTIVGFYFGSKSASDAVGAAGASLKSVRNALSDAANALGTGPTDVTGTDGASKVRPEDVGKTVAAIATMSKSTTNDFSTCGDFASASGKNPLEVLQAAAQGHDDLKDVLASAATSYGAMQAASKTCSDLDQQAKALASAPDAADKMGKLYDLAMQANHDFSGAQMSFATARDKILTAGGVG